MIGLGPSSNSATLNQQFESISHSKSLLFGLNELRCDDKLLDVTLIAENESFKAHRAVLAACSDYFRAMFTNQNMLETKQDEIVLKGVTARGIELLIDYAYTSKLELTRQNIQDILLAASYVQMDMVVVACSNYLESQIDLENVVDIASISELYSLEKLKQESYRFMCSHLKDFSKTNEINLLTSEQFEHLLNCDYPVDCNEYTILQIVLNYCVVQKLDLIESQLLFNKIRFNEIKSDDLDRSLRPFSGNKIYYNAVKLASQNQLKMIQTTKLSIIGEDVLTNSRGMELALVKIGGFGAEGITNRITYYLPTRQKWHNLTVIPHVEQCNYGVAVLGNELYVVGGCYDVCLKEYIHPFGFRYCPIKNKWATIAPMQSDRCRFTLNAAGNFLYAICGVSETNENDLDGNWVHDVPASNCERYNAKTDVWEFIPELPENRTQHAAAMHRFFLYVSGGLERNRVLSTMWRFNTFYEKWEQQAGLITPRVDHSMLVIKDKIFIAGGWCEDPATENRILVETIDVYDPISNQWNVETKIPEPKYHAGITAIQSKIYLIGGLNSDSIFDRASSSIQCYDLDTKQWTVEKHYPQNIWECTLAALYIPRCREDVEVVATEVKPESSENIYCS